MKRRGALRVLGAMGFGAVLPGRGGLAAVARAANAAKKGAREEATTCWLTPAETEGPYYFNANLVRQDIRTDFDTGIQPTGANGQWPAGVQAGGGDERARAQRRTASRPSSGTLPSRSKKPAARIPPHPSSRALAS